MTLCREIKFGHISQEMLGVNKFIAFLIVVFLFQIRNHSIFNGVAEDR